MRLVWIALLLLIAYGLATSSTSPNDCWSRYTTETQAIEACEQ